jgi:hypothetical protein
MNPRRQLASVEDTHPRWNWLFKLGGIAAVILLILFLTGITGITTSGSQPTTTSAWFALFQNNWLMVLFKLNIGWDGVQPDLLNVLNPVDIVIMALFGTLFLALYACLSRTSKIWTAIATSLPFLGIVVYLITHTAGRSGLLIGGMIFSAVMLRSDIFGKVSAYVGVAADGLLFFAGDLGTTIFSPSDIIAIFIGIGYVLWMIWFFLIGRRLFQQARLESQGAAAVTG